MKIDAHSIWYTCITHCGCVSSQSACITGQNNQCIKLSIRCTSVTCNRASSTSSRSTLSYFIKPVAHIWQLSGSFLQVFACRICPPWRRELRRAWKSKKLNFVVFFEPKTSFTEHGWHRRGARLFFRDSGRDGGRDFLFSYICMYIYSYIHTYIHTCMIVRART